MKKPYIEIIKHITGKYMWEIEDKHFALRCSRHYTSKYNAIRAAQKIANKLYMKGLEIIVFSEVEYEI